MLLAETTGINCRENHCTSK